MMRDYFALLFGLCLLAGCGADATPMVRDTPLPADTDTPEPSGTIDTRVREPDGMVMSYVPAGEFLMGGDVSDQRPIHTVHLDAFWIDETEVTNSQYQLCVTAGVCTASKTADNSDYNGAQRPVVGVDWNAANTYCQWSGAQLPTEAQWEKAARGTDGRIYPWGNTFDGSQVNFCDRNCDAEGKGSDADDGYAKTAPVGSYPSGISPYGALDMAGNVAEWVADWYEREYYARSPELNPQGPDSGSERVLRGGGWLYPQSIVRTAIRDYARPSFSRGDAGFRCALSAPEP